MAGVQKDLGALRAEAIRRHKAVGNKISRNKVGRKAEISGTQYDPRRELSKVKKYNRKQLETYIAKLNAFTTRKTQFVPDARFRPIPKEHWIEYKKTEKRLNELNRREFEKIADRKLPNGLTVRQTMAMYDPVHPQMLNPASNPGHRPLDRRSQNVASLEKLNKLIVDTRNRMTPQHRAKIEAINRASVDQMLEVIRNDDLRDRIRGLSSQQFDIIWNYSGSFANMLSLWYEAYKKMYSAVDDATEDNSWLKPVIRDANSEVHRILDWVEKQKF